MDKKGQMSILGLIFIFLTIAVFAAIQPSLNTVVSDAANNTTSDVEKDLINLIPLFIIVVIIASVVITGFGGGPRTRRGV